MRHPFIDHLSHTDAGNLQSAGFFHGMLMYGWIADAQLRLHSINKVLTAWMRQNSLEKLLGEVKAKNLKIGHFLAKLLADDDKAAGDIVEQELKYYIECSKQPDQNLLAGCHTTPLKRDVYLVRRLGKYVDQEQTCLVGVRLIKSSGIRMASQDETGSGPVDLINIAIFAKQGGRWQLRGFQGQLQEATLRVEEAALRVSAEEERQRLKLQVESIPIWSHDLRFPLWVAKESLDYYLINAPSPCALIEEAKEMIQAAANKTEAAVMTRDYRPELAWGDASLTPDTPFFELLLNCFYMVFRQITRSASPVPYYFFTLQYLHRNGNVRNSAALDVCKGFVTSLHDSRKDLTAIQDLRMATEKWNRLTKSIGYAIQIDADDYFATLKLKKRSGLYFMLEAVIVELLSNAIRHVVARDALDGTGEEAYGGQPAQIMARFFMEPNSPKANGQSMRLCFSVQNTHWGTFQTAPTTTGVTLLDLLVRERMGGTYQLTKQAPVSSEAPGFVFAQVNIPNFWSKSHEMAHSFDR